MKIQLLSVQDYKLHMCPKTSYGKINFYYYDRLYDPARILTVVQPSFEK